MEGISAERSRKSLIKTRRKTEAGRTAFGQNRNPARMMIKIHSRGSSHFFHMQNGFVEKEIQEIFAENFMVESKSIFTNNSAVKTGSLKA